MADIDKYYDDQYNQLDTGLPTGLGNIPGQDGFGTSDFIRLGLTMVGYVALTGLLTKRLGGATTRLTSSLSQKVARAFPRSAFATAERAAVRAVGSAPAPLASIVDELPRDNWIRQFRGRVRDITNPYYKWKTETEQIAAKFGNMSGTRVMGLKAQSLLKKNTYDRIAVVKGAMAVHAQDYLKRSVPFYLADRIIGGLHGESDKPSVFNVPGTLLDYAKFTAGFYPIDAFFVGGGNLLNYGVRGVGGAALQKFVGKIDPSMREHATKQTLQFFEKTLAYGKSVQAGLGGAFGSVTWRDTMVPSTWRKFVRPSGMLRNARNFIESFQKERQQRILLRNTRRVNRIDDDLMNMVSAIERTSMVGGMGGSLHEVAGVRDLKRQFLKDLRDRQAKPRSTFFEELLGVEKAKVAERESRVLAARIAKTGIFGKRSSGAIYNKLTKNLYSKQPIYRLQGSGDILDMRAVSPKYLFNRAVTAMQHSFGGVGGVAVGVLGTPLRIFMDKEVAADFYGHGEGRMGLGYIHKPANVNTEALFSRLGAIVPGEDEAGLFFLGKHYLVKPGQIVPINPYNSYRMLRAGRGSYIARAVHKHYGLPESRLMDVKELAETRAWSKGFIGKWRRRVHEHVLRRFEIGAGYGESESLFTWVSNLAAKYTKPHSVLNLLSNESRVFNKEFIAARARQGFNPKERTMAQEALQLVSGFVGRASINATTIVTSRPGMFRKILQGDVELGPGVGVNVMRALEDDHYLYRVLQNTNVRDSLFSRNRRVASTVNSVIGRSYDDFRAITEEAGSRGFGYGGKSTISKLQEIRNVIAEEKILSSNLRASELNEIAKASESEGLNYIRKSERKALGILTYKKQVLDAIREGTRSDVNDQVLLESLNTVMDAQTPLYQLAKQYIPPWSSGKIREFTRVPIDDPIAARIYDSPFVSVTNSFFSPGSRGFGGMMRSFFPSIWKDSLEDPPHDPKFVMSRAGMIPFWLADRFARIGEFMGFAPNNPDHRRSALAMGLTAITWGPAVAGLGAVYQFTDAAIDENPMFNGTAFDEGLTVAMADQVVKTSHTYHAFKDITGLTQLSKYMEGLMPGSIESPAASMVRTFAPPLVFSALGARLRGGQGAAIGMTAGLLLSAGELSQNLVTGEGLFAGPGLLSTRSKQQFEEEFSGRKEVPVRRGRFWELSRQNYQGKDIMYFRPNWFVRLKSQYEYTPDGLGSKMEAALFANPPMGVNLIGALIDPYHYERKHYLSRPYPETGGLGEEIPFVGPAISYITAKAPMVGPFHLPFTKPTIKMHHKELVRLFNSYDDATDPRNGGTIGYSSPNFLKKYEDHFAPMAGADNVSPGTASLRLPAPLSSTSLGATLGNMEYRGIIEPLGLVGFGYESAMGKIQGEDGRRGMFEPDAVMENASELYSYRRRYWDLNIGGQMGLTEFWRRFIPRRPFNTEYYNRIRNKMPGWLDTRDYFMNFAYGDPYTKVPEGLLRLPGSGYESARTVKKTFPGRASWIGMTRDEIVTRMLGESPPLDEEGFDVTSMGTYLHKVVQEQLARANLLVKAEALVYDPYSNVSGHMDAIVREGRKNKVVEIKTITTEALSQMTAPRSKHYSQVNFYMKASGIYSGQILYVSRDDPRVTLAFDVPFSQSRYEEDVAKMLQARGIAMELRAKNLGWAGEDYSHLDRLAILADVAPYSKKYKEELEIVRMQSRMGLLSDEDKDRVQTILKQRRAVVQKQEYYPYRFKGKIFSPDTEYTNLSTNENLKASAEYSFPERVAGAAWEMFCVPEDELIETHRGYIEARRVCENDLVRTHTGIWRAVTDVHVRMPESWDKMRTIRAGGHEHPLRTTTNHIIWTERGFVKAGDVTRGDVLLFPPIIIDERTDELDVMELADIDLISEVIDDVEMLRKKGSVKFFQRKVEKSQELMRLLGYYFARGGPIRDKGSDHGIRIGFCSDTAKLDSMRTASAMVVQTTEQTISGYDYVKFTSPVFALMIKGLFGYGKEKRIPDFVKNSDIVMLKAFVRGLTMNKSFNTFKLSSTGTLFDISKLLLRLHIAHHIIKLNSSSYDLVIDETDLQRILYGVEAPKNELMWFDEDDICHMMVTSVGTSKPRSKSPLYDFTVYEDHTYSTGLYTIHNSHLDTPIHTRFLHYRTPIEEYERTRLYGRDAAFWEHPIRDFAEPWAKTLVSSDSLLEGAARGAFMGGLVGSAPGAMIGSIAGGVYGAGRYVIGAKSGVPSDVKRKRELEAYFDKLEYMKAMRLHELTGSPDFLRKAGETMTGLNPLGMSTAGWTSMYRALPYAERPFFNAFMRTTDPDERQRIMELVPEDVGNLLGVRWGIQDGERNFRALSDFRNSQNVSKFVEEEGVPEVGWGGWAPAVQLEDVKLNSAKFEGYDAHDFGLGWKDQMDRMRASPFIPGPIQMTKLTHYDGQYMGGDIAPDKYDTQAAIQRIIREFGATGNVMIDGIPGGHRATQTGDVPTRIEITVNRSRALTATLVRPDRSLSPTERALLGG